ncbi:auxin-responsive protein SAUR32-like [Neltuma alba]|uniref:auxin-responsive protein SAUR32-like n=1 Tax=Neltuma alba TaxID=207710 RepID=UPI0010A32C48|nr:auxin-responsive protein SAUR32-like [Prosopis alba]XP_028796932.1 auxin-responsive protein SAUR32-like [Prosopis alba]
MVGSGNRSFKLKELGIATQHPHHGTDNTESDHEERSKAGIIKRYMAPPRGWLAIKIGREVQERIVVPVSYLNHPLFAELLKQAEEEYGFKQEGAIAIPCQLKHFKYVEAIIHREHHHHRLVGCFRL